MQCEYAVIWICLNRSADSIEGLSCVREFKISSDLTKKKNDSIVKSNIS